MINGRSFIVIGLLLLGLVAVTAAATSTTGTDETEIKTVTLTLGPADFGEGETQNLAVTDEGIVLGFEAVNGQYTSAALKAPLPFNVLVPSWSAEVPDGASLAIRMRTSKNGDRWDDWIQLLPNDDWMTPEDEDIIGQMIAVPALDGTHGWLQFSLSLSRYAGQPSPLLRTLDITLFDSTQGPTADELVARQAALDAEEVQDVAGYPKPSVIGRDTWCTDPACDYDGGLEYETVSHLIVHHTVSSNSSANWAAVVRAIWYYHTFKNGWGDIGYNYLVDMNGVLYEGHLGSDDVVGTHAAGANAGSMALAFIGTFTTPTYDPPGISPPAAMRNSAVELFAWKADQRDIDVHNSGYLPNVDWILPNLMGHRDVYGTTQCPGDQAYDLLPWLRDQVASRINSNFIYVDETSAAFSKNDVPGWRVPSDQCGHNGHAFYAWSTQDPGGVINRGEWRPNLAYKGLYELQAFVPYCITGAPETDGATYTIDHALGTSTVTRSQEDHVRTWMSLGTYELAAGNGNVIKLSNLTKTDSNLGVWFDALRLKPAGDCPWPSISNITPANNAWLNSRQVNFNWSIADGVAIKTTRLAVATDPTFTNLIFSENFAGEKTSHTLTFDRDYHRLYWRVSFTTHCDQAVDSMTAMFGVDTVAPVSAVHGVFLVDGDRIMPAWSGWDIGSGVAYYNIDYRRDPTTSWIAWLRGFKGRSAHFKPPETAEYWFRSQAVDAAGNVEKKYFKPDAGTYNAILLQRDIIFPLLNR